MESDIITYLKSEIKLQFYTFKRLSMDRSFTIKCFKDLCITLRRLKNIYIAKEYFFYYF